MSRLSNKPELKIGYTNHDGKHSIRSIVPVQVWYGVSVWYNPDQQLYFLKAYDKEREAIRDFALEGISPSDDWRNHLAIWGFYEGEVPAYHQGPAGVSELSELVSPEELNAMAKALSEKKQRKALPTRREHDKVVVEHVWSPNQPQQMVERLLLSIGKYEDGEIGEVFVNYPRTERTEKKAGSRTINLGADIAILISIALQYGAPVNVLRDAMGRSRENYMGKDRNMPHTIVGTILDTLAGGEPPFKEEPE